MQQTELILTKKQNCGRKLQFFSVAICLLQLICPSNGETVSGTDYVKDTTSTPNHPLLLIYETDTTQLKPSANNFLFQQITDLSTRDALKDSVDIVGTDKDWKGWGSKAKHISQRLKNVDENRLVVVMDSRDVLLNNLNDKTMSKFVENFKTITKNQKDAIVVGAESQCCVSALTHALPGDYLNDDLTRNGKKEACNSGQSNCLHRGDEYQQPWVEKLQQLAKDKNVNTPNIYPNTGIVVGRAKNILKAYRILNMKETEDGQALFTELMLKRPDFIIMDHQQQLIGNNAWTEGMKGCIFEWDGTKEEFVHPDFRTAPAFLHFQGKFYECYGKLASYFGYNGDMKRKLNEQGGSTNYSPSKVTYKQELHLTHTMTVADLNTAIADLNTNKDSLCSTIQAEARLSVFEAVSECDDAELITDPVVASRQLIRRLADPLTAEAEVVIKFPYTITASKTVESQLQTTLESWQQSVPTNIASKANTDGGQPFVSTMTNPSKTQSSAASIAIPNVLLALAIICFMK